VSDALKVFDRLGGVGRLLVGGIALVTIAVVFYLVSSAGPASYAPAFTNLSPKQAGDVEEALTAAHIPSKLGDAGSTVMVPSSQIDAARIAIDKANIVTGGDHQGMELVTGLGTTATKFQQDSTYQIALQGQLANEIQSIAGIQEATVNLTQPQQSLFMSDQNPPTASVLLDLGGGQIPAGSVRSIQRLVAGSVSGLTAKNVTVTDERGDALSSADDGVGDALASKLQEDAAYSNHLESMAQEYLDSLLGPGQATVVVNARIDADQTTSDSVTYGKKGTVVNKTSENEILKGSGAGASGTAGTASNVPGYTGTGGTSGNGNYSHTNGAEQSAVDQTQTHTVYAGGTPTHLFVSLGFAAPAGTAAGTTPAMSKTQTAAAAGVQALLGISKKDITAGTASFQTAVAAAPAAATKGKTATATGLPGVTPTSAGAAAAGGGPIAMITGYLKPAAALLGFLVLLFLARRSLKRRQALLGTAEARWMPTLAAPPIPVEDIELPVAPSPLEIAAAQKKALQAKVEDLADQRPADVAQQLRGWLAADS
jgi:flagellar M-ring protein FliF